VNAQTLQQIAQALQPHRRQIVEEWTRALSASGMATGEQARVTCEPALDALLSRLVAGDVEGLLEEEARSAAALAGRGTSLLARATAIRVLDRCLLPHLLAGDPDREALGRSLLALDELSTRRIEVLLAVQEEETARRLIETQEHAARAQERAREVQRTNEALRRTEAQSLHRAEQLGLLSSVAHRIAPVREPDEVMQQAADTIRARMNHTYVAVVTLDGEGTLVGRWSGRPGVGRVSEGRRQGPPGGVIGRAIRLRAPQVVGDVTADADYHPDVAGTRSEMVIPLLEESTALGALDFQSEQPFAFALDDVAAGETLAEFLVIALHNARLYQAARRKGHE